MVCKYPVESKVRVGRLCCRHSCLLRMPPRGMKNCAATSWCYHQRQRHLHTPRGTMFATELVAIIVALYATNNSCSKWLCVCMCSNVCIKLHSKEKICGRHLEGCRFCHCCAGVSSLCARQSCDLHATTVFYTFPNWGINSCISCVRHARYVCRWRIASDSEVCSHHLWMCVSIFITSYKRQ